MSIYVHDGSKWSQKSDAFMVHDGSKFVKADVKHYDGSKWNLISQQTYTTTWSATWSQSYNGADSNDVTYRVAKWGDTVSHYAMWYNVTWDDIVRWNNLKSPHVIFENVKYIVTKKEFPRKRDGAWLYQGRRPPESVTSDRGRQRSMIGFNSSAIRTALSGATIQKVEIYLKNQTSWNTTGTNALIGYHNENSTPADFKQSNYGIKNEKFAKGVGKWVEMPLDFANRLKNNQAKGFTLFSDSSDTNYFGAFFGHQANSSDVPKIRITYKK